MIGWLASDYWKERINADSFVITATKDGQPTDPQWTEMEEPLSIFVAKDVGVYEYTASIKDTDRHYCGSITTQGEIVGSQAYTNNVRG
ncbi:MAG: hypothetical protein ACLR23_22940 [Clostridia bacterium]